MDDEAIFLYDKRVFANDRSRVYRKKVLNPSADAGSESGVNRAWNREESQVAGVFSDEKLGHDDARKGENGKVT